MMIIINVNQIYCRVTICNNQIYSKVIYAENFDN